jgi:hypothetical protein
LLAGGCPAASNFLLLRQKKEAKKGDPQSGFPTLRYGQPAVLDYGGVSRKLACGSNKRDP